MVEVKAKRGRPSKDDAARRSKGDGGITFIKSRNLWCAQVDLGVDEDGKRKRKSFTTPTKKEALQKKKDFLMEYGQDDLESPKKHTRKFKQMTRAP